MGGALSCLRPNAEPEPEREPKSSDAVSWKNSSSSGTGPTITLRPYQSEWKSPKVVTTTTEREIRPNFDAAALQRSRSLRITGMGTQFAPHMIGPEALEQLVRKWVNISLPNVQKLLSINRRSGIRARPIIRPVEDDFWTSEFPPSIADVEEIVRTEGLSMAATACRITLLESRLAPRDISHLVVVTSTSAGSPGLELLLVEELGLSTKVDRVLLHGLGCGGGIAAMRVAANLASGASARDKVARILVVAVEVCSTSLRCNLEAMAQPPFDKVHIAPALYSDGASAFVLCNELAPEAGPCAFFELINWVTEILPGSAEDAYSMPDPHGWMTTLAPSIPAAGGKVLPPAFDDLLGSVPLNHPSHTVPRNARGFDWAVHAGGPAILNGVEQVMGLKPGDHLREAHEVYEIRGNTSSVSVLAVLDKMRRSRDARSMVVACSFGPGMFVDLALLRRCRRSRGFLMDDAAFR